MNTCQHWSQVEYLHLTVTNPNICLKGQHSYYSGAWDGPFEEVAVRYLHGDRFSRSSDTGWEPLWHIDRLHIGDYVQIAAGVKIIMGATTPTTPPLSAPIRLPIWRRSNAATAPPVIPASATMCGSAWRR